MNLSVVIQAIHPRAVFRVSHGARAEMCNVFVRIADESIAGFGEASPNPVYGEDAVDVQARLRGLEDWLRPRRIRSAADIARIWSESWPLLAPSRAAQCALDVALWDWLGRRDGTSVADLALGEKPRPIASFCTIGLSDPRELEIKTAELAAHPLIKIKSDAQADLAPVRFVRARTAARLAVDANCAWGAVDTARISRALAGLGVLFIEQPLAPAQHDRMPATLAASALPILADESCVCADDVERLPGHFSGFNIKLVKCGGLTPALRMLRRGRALGLTVMVGCMLESSLLIASAAVAAQHADFADLDGAWLLRDDPCTGLRFDRGMLHLRDAPGFGVEPAGVRW